MGRKLTCIRITGGYGNSIFKLSRAGGNLPKEIYQKLKFEEENDLRGCVCVVCGVVVGFGKFSHVLNENSKFETSDRNLLGSK